MLELVFVMVLALTWQAIRVCARAGIRKVRAPKRQSLCADCFYAHVQYGMNANRAISCTYGGFVRPVKLDVLYCTDYRERSLPFRNGAIGFVREVELTEEAAG